MNKIISILFFLLLMPVVASAQKIVPAKEVHMFGVAFSPLDSTVFITDLQPVSGIRVYKKSNLLYARNEYSSQLKSFLIDAGTDHMITSVSYDLKRNKAENKYIKMKQKYQKKGFLVKHITSDDFRFKEVEFDTE